MAEHLRVAPTGITSRWSRRGRPHVLFLFVLLCTVFVPGRVAAQAFIYAPAFGGEQVIVVDSGRRVRVALIPVAPTPLYVAASPTRPRVYVTHRDPGLVSVLDTATHSVISEIPVGPMLRGLDVSPDGKSIYVVSEGEAAVFVIDGETEQVVDSIPVGLSPGLITVRPDGREAWVTRQNGPGIDIVNLETGSMVGTLMTGSVPRSLRFTRDMRTAYVGNLLSRNIAVIDVLDRSVRSTIPMDSFPQAVALDPAEDRLYVGQSRPNRFLAIDLSTETVISSLSATGGPTGIVIAEAGSTAFVSQLNSREILTVDLSTLSLQFAIQAGEDTFHIALASPPVTHAPPEIECGEPITVVAEPGSCSAPFSCDQLAVCTDPDGDPVRQFCATEEAMAPESQITVICLDDVSTLSRECPVTVQELDPPEIDVRIEPSILWPPDRRLVEVEASVLATDGCGPAPFTLVSVTSSDPADTTGNEKMAVDVVDAVPGTGDTSFKLRAERTGGGVRTYTIAYEAEDGSGNKATATAQVQVRKD